MALREVVKVGDDVLRKTSKPVKIFDERLEDLIDDMWETMYANNGMGLAAPQVGVLKRVVVMDVNNMRIELINPEIIKKSGNPDLYFNGNLYGFRTREYCLERAAC